VLEVLNISPARLKLESNTSKTGIAVVEVKSMAICQVPL
jgi:hypothetical protein